MTRDEAIDIADEFDQMESDELYANFSKYSEMFGNRKLSRDARITAMNLASMAGALNMAKQLRLAGKIADAQRYERVADDAYKLIRGRSSNPTKRSRKPAKKVGRKSQMTGKPPTTRLKKRRAKPAIKGYFPNPGGKMRVYNARKSNPVKSEMWDVVAYDVRGNARDGYEVNDKHRVGKVHLPESVLSGTDAAVVSFLKKAGIIGPAAKNSRFTLDGDDDVIYFDYGGKPDFELQRHGPRG